MLRRRLMMQAYNTGKTAKYPLVQGTFETSAWAFVVAGNHFTLINKTVNNVGDSGPSFNISNINNNLNTSVGSANVNNLPELFSLKVGDHVVFSISNMAISGNADLKPQFNLRKANDSVSASFGTGQVTGDHAVVDKIVDSAVSASCIFGYVGGMKPGYILEFDVSFVVNGERWV